MTRARLLLAAALATAAFALGPPRPDGLPPIAPAAASAPTRVEARPFLPLEVVVAGSLLVRPLDGRPRAIAGAHRVALLGDGVTERWDFDRPLDAAQTLAARDALAADPSLRVDVDLWRQAQLVPDDEGYKSQWPLAQVHAEQAWDITTGDPDLVVAVVDTGVILDHPDLRTRLIAGYDFITDPANAGDGDGRDPDPADVGDESEASSGFHGTHIAGIIGAATGNGIGMAGVDWRCHLQPVRVLGVNHHAGKDSDIADGIRWAAGLNVPGAPQNQTPAKVINLSFGGPGYSQVLQDAVLAARARGSLVIASAGNSHTDALGNVPGALEGVMSVAAAGPDGALASYSNFGPRVDVLSPGGSFFLDAPVGDNTPGAIWSTSYVRATRQAVFAYAAGTSQAAAYASGVAALVRAAAPTLGPDVVAAVMRRGTQPTRGNCEAGCGDGLLDARAAVEIAARIAVTSCGAVGCGNVKMRPGELHPEEGCAVSPGGVGAEPRGEGGAVGLLLFAAALRRRRGPGRGGPVGGESGRGDCESGSGSGDCESGSGSGDCESAPRLKPGPLWGSPLRGLDELDVRFARTERFERGSQRAESHTHLSIVSLQPEGLHRRDPGCNRGCDDGAGDDGAGHGATHRLSARYRCPERAQRNNVAEAILYRLLDRRIDPRAARAIGVLAMVMMPCACASKDDSRQAQSVPAAPTVRIKDPVPTLRDGDLQISLGAGRVIEVEVTPVDDLEQVEVHASSPDQSLGRLGHPPFRFTLPASVLGEGGQRPCCITATDARAQVGEACFTAVP